MSKETFLVYPGLTNFTERKRKFYDVNDPLALLLLSIIAYIYSLGKKFYCTYLKTQNEMILSYAKPFNKKIHKQLVKIWKGNKKHVSHFSTLPIYDLKTKKKHKSVFLV